MKYLQIMLLAILSTFAPIKMAIITVLVLVLADLVTGVMASIKDKKPITSAGFRRTVIKIFLYEAALMLGFMAETYLLDKSMPICKMVSSMIGLTEMHSIVENMNAISGGELFAALITKLGSVNATHKD
jgi:hypothetical protein